MQSLPLITPFLTSSQLALLLCSYLMVRVHSSHQLRVWCMVSCLVDHQFTSIDLQTWKASLVSQPPPTVLLLLHNQQ